MFSFGKASQAKLIGVHPSLVAVVTRALQLTSQDFAVTDGVRTKEEQARLVAAGASQTMNSKHLPDPNPPGYGRAVDLVPFINGGPRWEWEPTYKVALAVRQAAFENGVELVWGGCWDINFTRSTLSPEMLVEQYVQRRKALGKKAFIDGPHYEMM